MKNIAALLILLLAMVSCGGGGSDDPTPTPKPSENKAPSVPTLVSPANGLLCISNTVIFNWNGSVDPEGDNITYEIVIAKDSQFANVVKTETSASLTKTYTLDKGNPYYWKVKAIDSKNKSSEYTSQWGFYTEGLSTSNYSPFAPSLISPKLFSIISGTSVLLEWNSTDLDNDPLTFDIYFSTTPILFTSIPILQSQSVKSYTKDGLIKNTVYYWRIDVKDSKGAKTIGQVWSFKTAP